MTFLDGNQPGSYAAVRPIHATLASVLLPALLGLLIFLSWSATATAQSEQLELRDTCAAVGVALDDSLPDVQALDACKRALEIRALDASANAWPEWSIAVVSAMLALLVGVTSGILAHYYAFKLARRKETHELDQAVHGQRLELYPKLTKTAEPLAIYFPPERERDPADVETATKITSAICKKIGREMSDWYFGHGGLLLSPESRDAYFILVRALTRASRGQQLRVPELPKHALGISKEILATYREQLGIRSYWQKQDEDSEVRQERDLAEVEGWQFGGESAATDPADKSDSEDRETASANRFRDYVFLQHLSSTLRTELTGDIRSRRRPAG